MGALGVVAFFFFSLLRGAEAQARPGDRVSFRTFYDELEPYGRWINDPEYGYVWSPDVERNFQPYGTRGHWVMTDYGNTWVSDYDWGWAPFHYGRWMFDDYYGWLWIPGTEWGPAWVDWRHSNGYYGWAPMGPRVTYILPASRWCFVPVRYITHPRIYSYCVPRTQVVNIYHNTTIINNYYERDNRKYVYGPRSQDIERATNRKVNVYRVENDNRAGRTAVAENSVRIYRPDIDNNRRSEAPARVESRDNSLTRSRYTDTNTSSTSRTERGSGSMNSGTVRNRSAVESQPGSTRGSSEVNAVGVGRSRVETSSEQRAPGLERVRQRESVRRAPQSSDTEAQPERATRADYPARSRETEVRESSSRSRVESAAPRSESGPVYRSSPSSVQEQPQPRSRQMPAAAPAPRQEQPQAQPAQRSSGSEGPARDSRRTRN
jgi:hypothetical protein